jgi:hypothetical protein
MRVRLEQCRAVVPTASLKQLRQLFYIATLLCFLDPIQVCVGSNKDGSIDDGGSR